MTKRRNVLIGVGGMVAIAGCIGDINGDNGDESEEANFELSNITPGDIELEIGEEIEFGVTIENTGDYEDSFMVEFEIGNGRQSTDIFELAPGEDMQYTQSVNAGSLDAGTYEYSFNIIRGGDDSIQSTLTIPERIYEKEETFTIPEMDIEITLTESGRTTSTPIRDADGIFQLYFFEVENIGNESTEIRRNDFNLEYDNSIVSPSSGVSRDLDDGINVENINPGVDMRIGIGYDIPTDAEPRNIIIEVGGDLFSDPEEYKINLE